MWETLVHWLQTWKTCRSAHLSSSCVSGFFRGVFALCDNVFGASDVPEVFSQLPNIGRIVFPATHPGPSQISGRGATTACIKGLAYRPIHSHSGIDTNED